MVEMCMKVLMNNNRINCYNGISFRNKDNKNMERNSSSLTFQDAAVIAAGGGFLLSSGNIVDFIKDAPKTTDKITRGIMTLGILGLCVDFVIKEVRRLSQG